LIQPTDYHYLVDPVPSNSDLTPEEQKLIVGGEATMWTEHVTPETVDSRIWPRTAAIAERLWSSDTVRDVDDMYRRIDRISLLLEGLGSNHIKNKEMLMRRLTDSYDTRALEVLVDVIEPLKIYERNAGDTMYTVFSPYTKIADVATPDQKVSREFRKNVTAWCSTHDSILETKILANLKIWKNNNSAFQELVKHSPVLSEASGLSENLSRISAIGLQAFGYIKNNVAPPSGWKEKNLEITDQAKEQGGRCDLQIVTAIEELIEAAESNRK
jgi:hexosaminidase